MSTVAPHADTTPPPRIVPSSRTRFLAARIVRTAIDEGADAARLVAEVEKGQEVALVGALACLAAKHNRPRAGGTPKPAEQITRHNLIACPRCQALIHEPCRTEGGWSRADHAERLMPRRCPCGEPIPKRRGRDLCDECRVKHRRQQQREASRRFRARQKGAA